MAFKDFSTNNFQLTAFGNAQISTSVKKYGDGSGYFPNINGNGNSKLTLNNEAFAFGTGDFTVEAWVYLTNIYFWIIIATTRPTNVSSSDAWHIGIDGDGRVIFYSNEFDAQSPSSTITTNQWYHVAATRSGNTLRLFVDGNIVATNTNYTKNTTRTLLGIGQFPNFDGSFSGEAIPGYIDDLRITKGIARYTSNFTPPQQQLPTTADPYFSNVSLLLPMNLGPFTDSSTNNFELTAVGNTDLSKSVVKYGTASVYFDGNGDYLELTDNDAFELEGNDFTIECWINITRLKGYQFIVGKNNNPPQDQNGWVLYLEQNSPYTNQINFVAGNGSWSVILFSGVVPSINTWYHVAVTRSGNIWRIFIDGDLKYQQTNSIVLDTGNYPMYIGLWTPSFVTLNQTFEGYVDDFRITKGVARYTANFTPPQQQLPAPSDPYQDNVSLLLHMDSEPIYKDLVAFWNLNDLSDNSGNGNTLTNNGSVQFVSGKIGNCAQFDGTNYFSVAMSTLPQGSQNRTISLWFKTSNTNAQVPFTYGTSSSGQLCLFYINGGASQLILTNYGDGAVYNANLADNQWHHCVLTISNSTWAAYVDGVLVVSKSLTTNTTGTTLQLGTGPDGSFIGLIDAVGIWNRALTQAEINLLYNNGNGKEYTLQPFTDSSSNNFALSAFGNAQISTSVKKFGSGSAYFDGGGDRIEIQCGSELDFPADFTVELWVYVISCDSEISLFSIASPIDSYGPMLGILPQSFGSTGTPVAEWLFGNGSWNFQLYGGQANEAIPLQTWTHLAMTRQNGVIRCFVNGILTRSVANTTAAVNFNQLISIGGRTNFGQYLNGYIDELRVTKGVARYTSNFVPHTAPFVNPPPIPSGYLAFWKLADLTDSSPNGNNLVNTNNVQFVPGKIGNCAQWNSPKTVTQDLRCTNSSSLNFGTGDFTVSLWAYPFTFSNDSFKNICCLGSQMNGRCAPFIEQNGNLRIVTNFSVPSEINHPMNFNAWNHIVYTRGSGVVSVYLNNVYLNQFNYTSSTDGNFFIGLFNDQIGGTSFQYEGRIDAVGIWNRPLTQSEIDILYNNGNGKEP